MLQRAANNAYSHWWASHVRTKQSKWLDQSLQDMEEKVAETLRILDDDGDSFAKRAEMYYRRRPELVNFIEESFRAYKVLADRYDHLSKELQSANRTVASVYPGQVESIIGDDSEEESEQVGPNVLSTQSYIESPRKGLVPKVPDTPKKDFRSRSSMLLVRKGPPKRTNTSAKISLTPCSGLTKDEALHEIDKLQKDILALQTEKEFVRSIYERAYEKYWEIEDKITEMQKRVSSLEDEFGAGNVIEDNDARALIAATALRSCQDTLIKLQEVQAQSSKEAKVEYERVKEAHEMFETLRDEFVSKFMSQQDQDNNGDKPNNIVISKGKNIDEESVEHEVRDVGLLRDKIMEKLEVDSCHSFTVTEVAGRIDELVNKVVTLKTAVSSQTGLVKRLRSETDELETNIKKLEDDKEILVEGSEDTNKKLKELEEELRRVKLLNRSVRSQDNSLQTHFTEATCDLELLSGKLNDMKPDVEENTLDGKPGKEFEKRGDKMSLDNLSEMKDVKTIKEDDAEVGNNNKSISRGNISFMPGRIQKLVMLNDHYDLSDTISSVDVESQDFDIGEEDQPNWRQMFTSGLDDREKILFEEYTSVLRNYKDVRVKLNDVEKKNRDTIFELALQIRELKNSLVKKDTKINYLHQKLNSSYSNHDESPYTVTTEYKYTPHEALLRNTAHGSNLQDPENSPLTAARTNPFVEPRTKSVGDIDLSSMKSTLLENASPDKLHNLSSLEKKFRSDIDDLLEENLEFWLRFSTSVHQIQKFQNSIQDLKSEIKRIKESKGKSDGYSSHSHSKHQPVQSQLRAIFRHLREIRTELSLWLEHNSVLQDELHGRYSSLCNILDEIARANNSESAEEKGELSGYQAAKFQGEILNMKQENSKVASELQAGLSLVKGMKNDVEKTLDELDQAIGISSKNNNLAIAKNSSNRPRIPLKSFLFGVKLKKQKQSIIAYVNPAMHKQYNDMRSGNNSAPI